ncbi:chitobiosyldiphosphodolichol beta-mannosyltransferase isoform X2 [Phyllopteryx taeniolatus]|uniref:chitobiosyldiphosphodolichol beta-mannosyltransferase isoform X2 n=1 Tax=Phyllopteryx taeniolatus TaxID=161469 RepID=UPI002AD20273|nr:chitobiosyldiphosphodolichol beta-mannosyltransferase isoform X2 [Phyllopteryx taeniolatus]
MAPPAPSNPVPIPTLFVLIPLFFWAICGASSGVWWPLVSVTVAGLAAALCWLLRRRDADAERRVCVLVLGDIGRSPRMQYHSLSLSKHGYEVTFVGYLDSKPHRDVLREDRIHVFPIAEVKGLGGGPKILTYVTKVTIQFAQVLAVLLMLKPHGHILMQNPPGLPGMASAWLACVLRGGRLVIDWHNYGYTIMALHHGDSHPLVRLAKWYEHVFGPLASQHLCVTNAMKEDLRRNWGIKATTLYDRPAAIFGETPPETRHELFVKLSRTLPAFRHSGDDDNVMEKTVFSERDMDKNTVTLRPDRPALLISSTSWTEDEDFSILLQALQEYEEFILTGETLPPLICVITGKGPQKEHYKKIIDSLHLEHVKICTPWLAAEDYPVLLGCGDLGVCLHKSSSGLDLPMKVVDMFGCCLPVCAVHFLCLKELVKHEHNGLIFSDGPQLARQLKTLLSDFPSNDGKLRAFRKNLHASRGERWDDNWDQHVLPLLSSSSSSFS